MNIANPFVKVVDGGTGALSKTFTLPNGAMYRLNSARCSVSTDATVGDRVFIIHATLMGRARRCIGAAVGPAASLEAEITIAPGLENQVLSESHVTGAASHLVIPGGSTITVTGDNAGGTDDWSQVELEFGLVQ